MANSRYVSWRTFGVVGTIVAFFCGLLATIALGVSNGVSKDVKALDNRTRLLEVCVGKVETRLDAIDKSMDDLKTGQTEIMRRLPSQ